MKTMCQLCVLATLASVVMIGWTPTRCLGLDLVRDGQSVAKIVVPDEANPPIDEAANLLVRYVAEITGVKLEIVKEGDPKSQTGPQVVLGATKAAKAVGIDVSSLKYDGFVWKVTQGNLFIAGRDISFLPKDGLGWNWSKRACRGTAAGVVRLLEDYGGVRWFLPTSKGEVVPKATTFSVPDALDHKEEPGFGFIGGDLAKYEPWTWNNGIRLAVNVFIQGHTWEGALRLRGDPQQLFDRDPTIFALVDGKRLYTPSNQFLCTMHPNFVEMNVKYFSTLFDAGYQWAEYNQSDGYVRCNCEKCNAMDQMDEIAKTKGEYWNREIDPNDKSLSPAERLWVPFAEIAEQLYRKYPDRRIIPLAYGPSMIPSQKVKKFPPNVMVAVCRQEPQHFAAYAGFEKTVWTYWWGTYRVQGFTPKSGAHQTAARVRDLAANRVVGVFACGGGEVWGLEGPAYYVFAKLAQNPSRDVEQILNKYYSGVFRAAAPEMKEFFNLLEERIAIGEKVQTTEEHQANECNMPAEKYFPAAYPPGILAAMDGILARARSKVRGDDFASHWLALTEIQYCYLKIVAAGFCLYQEYQKNKNPENRQKLLVAVESWKAFFKELEQLKTNEASLNDWFPSWQNYISATPSGGWIYGQLDNRPPFNGQF